MTGAAAEIVLADAGWLTDPATTAVLDALEAAGGPGCVRFVGGCVRNAVMGRAIADIDLATAKAKAMRYFGDIPRGRAITAPAAEPPVLTAPINQSFTGPVSTAQIARTWPVPGGRDPANFSLDAVSGLMTGIDGAPLFDKLVRQDKLFNNLSADNTTYRGVGEFTIYGSVRKGVDPNVAAKALSRSSFNTGTPPTSFLRATLGQTTSSM